MRGFKILFFVIILILPAIIYSQPTFCNGTVKIVGNDLILSGTIQFPDASTLSSASVFVSGTPIKVISVAGTSVGGFPSGLFHVTSSGTVVNSNSVVTGHSLFNGNTQLWYLGSVSSSNDNIAFINRQNANLSLSTNGLTRVNILAGGDVGIGTTAPSFKLEVNGSFGFKPSSDQALTAGQSLLIINGITRVAGNGGAVTLTSTPSISDGAGDGQIAHIQGTNDTNTLTFQDESSLANSGLQLSGGVNFTLGIGDMLVLIYDSGDDNWYEISRSDN